MGLAVLSLCYVVSSAYHPTTAYRSHVSDNVGLVTEHCRCEGQGFAAREFRCNSPRTLFYCT